MHDRGTSNRIQVEESSCRAGLGGRRAGRLAVLVTMMAAAPASGEAPHRVAAPVRLDTIGLEMEYDAESSAPPSLVETEIVETGAEPVVATAARAPIDATRIESTRGSGAVVRSADRHGRRVFAVAAMAGAWLLLHMGLARVRTRRSAAGCGEA